MQCSLTFLLVTNPAVLFFSNIQSKFMHWLFPYEMLSGLTCRNSWPLDLFPIVLQTQTPRDIDIMEMYMLEQHKVDHNQKKDTWLSDFVHIIWKLWHAFVLCPIKSLLYRTTCKYMVFSADWIFCLFFLTKWTQLCQIRWRAFVDINFHILKSQLYLVMYFDKAIQTN